MNKYIKIVSAFAALLLSAGCNELDLDHLKIPEPVSGGGVRMLFEPGKDVLEYLDIQNTSIEYELIPYDFENGNLIASYEMYYTYTNALTGEVSDTVLFESVSALPANKTITAQQLAQPHGLNAGDLGAGDSFNFFMEVLMKDGRKFDKTNTSDDILLEESTRATFAADIFVGGCPTELPASGKYSSSTEGDLGSGTLDEVTVTSNGDGTFTIDEISSGVLGQVIGDPSFKTGGGFSDFCNVLIVNQFNPPGLVPVSQTPGAAGSYDPDTGIIVLEWSIIGIASTTTLTPK